MKESVSLELLQSSDEESLRQIFNIEDVSRFYLGIHREPIPGEIDQLVSNRMTSAKNTRGGKRSTFNGQWIIRFQGQTAGFFNLTAVEANFMPDKVTEDFKKKNDDELYLAVGYALSKDFRGKNIIPEVLSMALQFAESELKAKYVFASTNNLNNPSKAVLLKAGFFPVMTDEKRTKFSIELMRLN